MIYNLKDYSYLDDNSLAVSIIMSKISDGDTVKLGGGTVELDGRYATPKTIYLPRYSNDKKYYAFCVDNKKNITIDGEGAYLLFDGNVSPFGFENCENVTLKNFVIDYKTPCMIQGKIVEADENFIVVDFSACNLDVKYDMEHKMLLFRESCDSEYLEADSFLLNEFDPELKKHSKTSPDYFLCVNKPHPVYGFMSACVDTEVLENGHFRLTYSYSIYPEHRYSCNGHVL